MIIVTLVIIVIAVILEIGVLILVIRIATVIVIVKVIVIVRIIGIIVSTLGLWPLGWSGCKGFSLGFQGFSVYGRAASERLGEETRMSPEEFKRPCTRCTNVGNCF